MNRGARGDSSLTEVIRLLAREAPTSNFLIKWWEYVTNGLVTSINT